MTRVREHVYIEEIAAINVESKPNFKSPESSTQFELFSVKFCSRILSIPKPNERCPPEGQHSFVEIKWRLKHFSVISCRKEQQLVSAAEVAYGFSASTMNADCSQLWRCDARRYPDFLINSWHPGVKQGLFFQWASRVWYLNRHISTAKIDNE